MHIPPPPPRRARGKAKCDLHSRRHRLSAAQINCSYYSAVGDRDDWYILARAIQLFTPGIPLIYYVGLLAGRNDLELVEETKTGRDINRHPYTLDEAVAEAERPVVKVPP